VDRVVVTGAAGFVGSHLAEHLLRHGARVTGLDARSPASDPGAAENLAGLVTHPGFHLVVADLLTADLTSLMQDVPALLSRPRPAVPGALMAAGRRHDRSRAARPVLGEVGPAPPGVTDVRVGRPPSSSAGRPRHPADVVRFTCASAR
jgi:nucleoside-diphosphate-sugar epimerase